MIQFTRAVGLEVSLASYGMLEDLLLKTRVGGGDLDALLEFDFTIVQLFTVSQFMKKLNFVQRLCELQRDG